MEDSETLELRAGIVAGHYDGQLEKLQNAITARLQDIDGPDIRWRLDLDDISVTEDDLTMEEAAAWEKRSGLPWRMLRPANLATIASSLIVTVLMTRNGMSEEDAVERTNKLTAAAVAAAMSNYEVVAPPLGDE